MSGGSRSPALLTVLRGMLRSVEEARAALPGPDRAQDWAQLVTDAQQHRLSAVVLGELARLGRSAPPPQAVPLAQAARLQVANALQVRVLLQRLLAALGAEGIVPVLLKGHGLASRLYPDPLARPLTDVDLLVAPEELARAERVLSGLGLQRVEDAGHADVYSEHHHVAFTGPAGSVDLHFRALHGFGGASLAFAHVAPGLREGRLEGQPVRFLGPEDELVYLAAHAATHVFIRVGWLLDLALLLQRHPALDWRRVEETAAQAQVQSALRVAATALEVALHVPLPAPPQGPTLAGSARTRLVASLLTEEQLVSARLAGSRVGSFLLRALMADRLPSVGRHVVEGALRGSRRAVLQRLQRHTPA